MNWQWTQTTEALEGFLKILACGKCQKAPERPMRLVNCGHMFCDTCCTIIGSACLKCNMPFSPNEIQPHHRIAQMISHYQTIKEAIEEMSAENKSNEAAGAPEVVEKEVCEEPIDTAEKDLEQGTPGYRGPTQNSPHKNKKQVVSEDPVCTELSQINGSLKGIDIESETPGFRGPTQMNASFKGDDVEQETPGYRDLTQIAQGSKEEGRMSRKMSLNLGELDDRVIKEIIGVPCSESPILAPATLPPRDIPVSTGSAANSAIAESTETVEQRDTISVGKLGSDFARELEEVTPKKIILFNSKDSEYFSTNSGDGLASIRQEISDPVAENSRESLGKSSTKSERALVKKPVIFEENDSERMETTNASINSKESFAKSNNSSMAGKKQELESSASSNQRKAMKKATKTIEEPKRQLKTIDKSAVPKNIPKNVNKRNAKGESILHSACVKGQEDYVEILLKSGANPNTKDNASWTALQESVTLGHLNVCKTLLQWGASPNTPGMDNRTALHNASMDDKLEEAALLCRFKASRDVYDKFGKRPIDYAISDEMRALLSDNKKVESLVPDNVPDLNATLDHSILTPNAKVVVLPLNLSSNNKKMLVQMAPKIKVAVSATFRPAVTHIVVETNERNIAELTYNVMLAILEGKWIINSQWIAISSDVKDISDIDLEMFQVRGAPNPGTPERARLNEEAQNPRLFNNCSFYFTIGVRSSWSYGKLELTKQLLTNLVLAGQGEILNREPDPEDVEDNRLTPFHVAHNPRHPLHKCSTYIIYMPGKEAPRIKYNMPHMKTLPLAWFFECIEKFELVNPIFMGIS